MLGSCLAHSLLSCTLPSHAMPVCTHWHEFIDIDGWLRLACNTEPVSLPQIRCITMSKTNALKDDYPELATMLAHNKLDADVSLWLCFYRHCLVNREHFSMLASTDLG